MTSTIKRLHRYCQAHSTAPNTVLQELERETHLKTLAPQMLSGPLQGQLLQMISYMIQPKCILEVGTFTGYASLCLAAGLTAEGQLHTIEANEELEYLIRKYIRKADMEQQIQLHIGDAKTLIPQMDQQFDLVFIDAGKQDNALYFDLIIDKVRPGGYLLADNVLWSGKVADSQYQDRDTQVIRAFNQKVQQDPRVENVMLPLRDGLIILRKH
ncbi:MAG: O-methyltransferase [Bacteroidota bacterium]